MNEIKVSVIVPIYNVEEYLRRCVDSILNQTYQNMEIILVDDGSTDGSAIICDNYEKKDDRIVVIHKKNGGLSDARNEGIKKSTGEYIAFVDSDDYINEKYVEMLLNAAIENDAEIAFCGFERVNDVKTIKSTLGIDVVMSGIEIQKFLYSKKINTELFNISWNKIYKRNLFSEIWFPYGRLNEDYATTYRLFYQTNRIVGINSVLYYYYIREGSITNDIKKKEKSYYDMILTEKERIAFYNERQIDDAYIIAKKRYFYRIMDYISEENFLTYYYDLKNEMMIIFNECISNKKYNLKEKIGMIYKYYVFCIKEIINPRNNKMI